VTACSEIERLLVARPLGGLDEGSAALDEHVAACERCAKLARDAESLARELALPEDEPRDGWSALAERIESDRKRRGVKVAVGCAYCKDALPREEAVYCAACLTPQHKDCFAEHGRCAAAGCGETRYVESRVSATPRPRRRRRAPLALLVSLVVGVGAAAALVPREHGHIKVALTPGIAAEDSETYVDVDAKDAKVHDLVTQIGLVTEKNVVTLKDPTAHVTLVRRASPLSEVLADIAQLADCTLQRRGSIFCLVHEPRLAIKFDDTDVRDAIRDLAAHGEVNVSIAPEVHGTVTCDLHNVHWRKALVKIAKTVGDFEVVEESYDFIRVIPRAQIQKEQKLTIILELKHRRGAAAADLKRFIDLAVRQGGELEGVVVDLDAATSSLVATATQPRLEALRSWVARYDVPLATKADGPSFYGTPIRSESSTVCYVIDISGSMGWDMGQYTSPDGTAQTGCRLDRVKAELVKSIVALPPDWRFDVIAYDCGTYLWQKTLVAATDVNKQAAITWVQALQPQGATGTGPAVSTALALDPELKLVVLLTDGAPNCGAGDSSGDGSCTDAHRKLIAQANKQHAVIDVFGIGATGVFKDFCLGVAQDSGGVYADAR